MAVGRPQRPTLEELRAVVQPPSVLGRAAAEHWTGTLYMRRFSIHLTRVLLRTPLTANGVTGLMIVAGVLAGPALLLPGLWGPVVAVALTQLQMLLDCSDGEVARWRGTSGPRGPFLDQIGHFTAEGSIGLFLGVRATGWVWGQGDATSAFAFLAVGALLMAGIWFNKALNLMVPVARLAAGAERLPDAAESKQVAPTTLVGRLRRLARFVPFHRMFHSIELTLVTLAVALAAAPFGSPLAVDRGFVVVMAVAIYVVSVGHGLAIWASPRLSKDVA